MERFWIVIANRHELKATARHTCRENAVAEAKRLAIKEPGIEFFVAAVIRVACTVPRPQVLWTELVMPVGYEAFRRARSKYYPHV